MGFKITKRDKNTLARKGIISAKHGGIKTPVFLPIATYGAVKNLSVEELRDIGAQIILSNTYHLWLRPGIERIKKSGGLHKFMNWQGPILTDSGGFQVFSLAKHRKLTEKGVEFRDPLNGEKYLLTPEKSIQIQLDLGSDIILALDDCPSYPCSREEAKKSLELTMRWAGRCKKYFDMHGIESEAKQSRVNTAGLLRRGVYAEPSRSTPRNDIKRPLIFGIVQGSVYKDLRQESARRIAEMGFDGFAIGGVSVGEPRKYVWKVLDWIIPILPENKPRHLLGVGKPEEIVKAIQCGIDMFDCVIPTREARHGRLYKYKYSIPKTQYPVKNKFYEVVNITNSKFRKDFRPIDENCECYTCRSYSLAYLNHLFKMKELLGYRLATIHNLHFYMEVVRKATEF